MRVVVAVQGWPGGQGAVDLTAADAAVAVESAWATVRPDTDMWARAVADGSPLTADLFEGPRSHVGGALVVEGPGGLWLAPSGGAKRWNPHDLSTALIGLAAAGERRTVHVPLGDDSPAGDAKELWGGQVAAVRAALAKMPLIALVGSQRPLLGFHGLSSEVRSGRESDAVIAAAAQEQERRWAAIALEGDHVASTGALLGSSRTSDAPGSGAAGGLAYCLAVLGAYLAPASAFVVEACGVRKAAEGADLVVAVCDELTPRALDTGVASAVAQIAGRLAVPAVALAPGVHVGKRDLMAAGLASAHEARAGATGLADGVRRLAQTWAPRGPR